MDIYERFGRLTEEYAETIDLLHRLKTGECSLSEVLLTPTGWSLLPVVPPSEELTPDQAYRYRKFIVEDEANA